MQTAQPPVVKSEEGMKELIHKITVYDKDKDLVSPRPPPNENDYF